MIFGALLATGQPRFESGMLRVCLQDRDCG
jgi:hypothetical protein